MFSNVSNTLPSRPAHESSSQAVSRTTPAILFSSFHPFASRSTFDLLSFPECIWMLAKVLSPRLLCRRRPSPLHPRCSPAPLLHINKWIQLFIWKTRTERRAKRCWFLFVCHFSNQQRRHKKAKQSRVVMSLQSSRKNGISVAWLLRLFSVFSFIFSACFMSWSRNQKSSSFKRSDENEI